MANSPLPQGRLLRTSLGRAPSLAEAKQWVKDGIRFADFDFSQGGEKSAIDYLRTKNVTVFHYNVGNGGGPAWNEPINLAVGARGLANIANATRNALLSGKNGIQFDNPDELSVKQLTDVWKAQLSVAQDLEKKGKIAPGTFAIHIKNNPGKAAEILRNNPEFKPHVKLAVLEQLIQGDPIRLDIEKKLEKLGNIPSGTLAESIRKDPDKFLNIIDNNKRTFRPFVKELVKKELINGDPKHDWKDMVRPARELAAMGIPVFGVEFVTSHVGSKPMSLSKVEDFMQKNPWMSGFNLMQNERSYEDRSAHYIKGQGIVSKPTAEQQLPSTTKTAQAPSPSKSAEAKPAGTVAKWRIAKFPDNQPAPAGKTTPAKKEEDPPAKKAAPTVKITN